MKIVLVSALLILPAIPLRGPSRAQNASSARQPDSSQTKPFSRAAWIAAHARSLRFSGGVLPATAPPFNPPGVYVPPGSFSSVLPASFMPSLASTQPVQASKDLLPTDTSAEPGTHAEPYLDANQSNPMNLVGGWQENRFANGGARCVTYGTSFDGGQTWTTNLIPHLTVADGGPWERASDPWVAFGPNNRVYYSSLLFNETTPDNAIGVSLSSDGGMTWGDPVEINHVKKQFNDKDAIAADSYPASPHLGNVYAAWDVNNNTGKQWVVVSRSTDAGRTFESPVRLGKKGTENIGAIPRVGPLGTVYVVWLGGSGGSCGNAFYISRSDDGGATWRARQLITEVCSPGVQGLRTGDGLPSFAIDPSTGFLYVAWQDAGPAPSSSTNPIGRAVMTMSTDQGKTWSPPVRVNDGPDDAPVFTVSIAAMSGGEVAISHYSLQNDPARRSLADEYVRVSTDGGRTFAPSLRVTPASFDLRDAALVTGGLPFLGDYQGLAGAAGTFHPLWINPGIQSSITGRPEPEAVSSSVQ